MERLQQYFDPRDYKLDVKIDRKHEVMIGRVAIRGIVYAEYAKFHAVNMNIKSVRYRKNDMDYNFDTYDGIKCAYKYQDNLITVPITPDMVPNFYRTDRLKNPELQEYDFGCTIIIEFESRLKHDMQGCYISTYKYNGEEKKIVATQFESHYAREAFPCIDEPAAKARFRLSINLDDIKSEDTVLANTPCCSRYSNRFVFEETPPMSTYLLAWVIGPFRGVSTVNHHGVKVTSYAPLNQSTESLIFANETAARALDYYDEKFGISYPLPKLDQVALPDFEAGAMENWGLVTYRESMMLADSTAALDTKKTVATTVTHELSHQWFGDLVTMTWWDDLWLNESFATMIEYCAADAIYPELNVWEDFFTGDCLAALRRDALRGVQAVQQEVHHPAEIATLFDAAIVYAKGAHLMLMLMRRMGDTAFYRGLSYYFDKHKYQNTVGDDLWNSLQVFADFDVREFMHAWISQPGYPALQTAHNGSQTWWEQQRFLLDGTTDDTKWPLPEVNDDMSGHYLIDLGESEFQAKLKEFDDLSEEQKLRLLIDRMLLAKAGNVTSASLLDLLAKFTNERSSAVWSIVANIVGDLKLFCPPESEAEQNYQALLRQLTHELIMELGLKEKLGPNDTELRNILLGIACYDQDEEVLRKLADLYQTDLATMDAELRGYIMAAKMHFNESEVFEEWLSQYAKTCDAEIKVDILYSLAAYSKNPEHIERLVRLLHEPEIVRPQDHLFLYIYLIRNYRSRDQALAWLIENWSYVIELTGDKSIEDYPRYTANTLRTEAEAEKFYTFFDTKKDDPILKRTLEISHTEIDARLALIKSQSTEVDTKLKELKENK